RNPTVERQRLPIVVDFTNVTSRPIKARKTKSQWLELFVTLPADRAGHAQLSTFPFTQSLGFRVEVINLGGDTRGKCSRVLTKQALHEVLASIHERPDHAISHARDHRGVRHESDTMRQRR